MLYADQQYAAAGPPGCLDHRFEIGACGRKRQPAQAIVGAELQDDDIRMMLVQGAGQPGPAATGGLAAHAGVHDTLPVTFGGQFPLQQARPALAGLEAVAGAQAVAEHEDGRRSALAAPALEHANKQAAVSSTPMRSQYCSQGRGFDAEG